MSRAPARRRALAWLGLAGLADAPAASTDDDDRIAPGRALRFPRDHGAHPGARTEWWYATGWLGERADAEPLYGFQLTLFRSRLAARPGDEGRFVPRQLLFAHAALTDLRQRRHRHAQRLQRWSGGGDQAALAASTADTALALGSWTLRHSPEGGVDGRYLARLPAPDAGFDLALTLATTQPRLLQGAAGFSRKGPSPTQASHYVSQPQLAVQGTVRSGGEALAGLAWLDHEWSDTLLAADAVGWDWIGLNLADGSALTAFRLRRRDGSVVWAGGGHRAAGTSTVRDFAPEEVRFEPGRVWISPQTGARYPVAWRIATPAGSLRLEALLDGQELDGRGSTGTVYWEGLADARGDDGRRLGLGYLEMTGYAGTLKML